VTREWASAGLRSLPDGVALVFVRSENSYPRRRQLAAGSAHGRCHGGPYANVSTGRRQWWSACFGFARPRWGESDGRASGCRLLVVVSTTLTSRAPSEGPDASVSQSEAVQTKWDQRFSAGHAAHGRGWFLSSNDIWWDMMLEGELTLGGGPATPRGRQPDRPTLGASNSPGSCFVAP
jgi:hypothetical protein